MIIWIDAQFSPAIATWLNNTFSVGAVAVRDLQLREAKDAEIFSAARRNDAVVMTKDKRLRSASRSIRTTTSSYLGNLWEHFQCTFEGDSCRCVP